jgi:hypothetical protein
MEVHVRVDRRRQRSTASGRAASLLAIAALGCVVAGGCAAVLGIDDDVEVIQPSGSGGSGAGSPGAGASSGSGGSGGAVGCIAPAECPGAELGCSVRTCIEGVCGLDDKRGGTLAPQQTPGDCKRNDCDGAGNVIEVLDPNDFEDDGEDCTMDSCQRGEPVHVNLNEGSACGVGLACDGNGKCTCSEAEPTACGVSTTCQTKACVDSVCTTTNQRDGLSCDTCKQCAQGQCVVALDGTDPADDCGECAACELGVCVNTPAGQTDPDLMCPGLASACNGAGKCQCDDDIQNGGETGVDCGSAACQIACPVGAGCQFGLDCGTKCCNTQNVCGSCDSGCTCKAPDAVCHAGGVCGD